MKYDFGRGTYLAMNYSYTKKEIRDPEYRFWPGPERLGTLMANVRLSRHFNFNSYLLYRGGWTRDVGDSRDDPPDYAIVNATLIARNFGGWFKGLELRGSVYNVFDKDYISPHPPGQLPDDLPMPGRSFLLEARYMF
jgi:iron complex outermembrane receptor protein